MRVRWTKPAIKDLDDIEEYIAEDNIDRALDFIGQLIDLGESLSEDPERGSYARWINDKRIRELHYHNYTIIYEILSDEVQIHEVHNDSKMRKHFMGIE